MTEIAQSDRAYYLAHKDEISERKRAHYLAHKDEIAEQQRAYYLAHKEQKRAYRLAHKDEIAQQMRAYYLAHKEQMRAYRLAHKDEIAQQKRAYHLAHKDEISERMKAHYKRDPTPYINRARARRGKLNLLPSYTEHEYQLVRERTPNCVGCGVLLSTVVVHRDHIVPLSMGGSNTIENIQPLCAACNLSKHNRPMKEWMATRIVVTPHVETRT